MAPTIVLIDVPLLFSVESHWIEVPVYPVKVSNVRLELDLLEKTWRDSGAAIPEVAADEAALQRVNEALWDIEDQIRDKELAQAFDRSEEHNV